MYFAVDPLSVVDIVARLTKLIEFNPESRWTAVVDSAFDHDRGKCDYPGAPEALYACDELDSMLEVSPLLIPLITDKPALLADQLHGLAEHCSGRPMLSVVASSKIAEELTPNWQKCARVTTDDGQKLLLRFADTRVLPILPEALTQASWAALTYEISHWWYVDRAGKLAHVPIAAVETVPRFPLTIGKREFRKLLERGEPDSVIDAISMQLPEILPTSNKAAFFERMKTVCEFAREREIDAFPDVVALGIFDTLNKHQSLTNPKLLKLVAERGWKQGEMAAALTKLFD